MEKKKMQYLIIDIETGLNKELLEQATDNGLVDLPKIEHIDVIKDRLTGKIISKYAKQSTVDKHLENIDVSVQEELKKQIDKYESAIEGFKTHPLFTYIKLITVNDNGTISQLDGDEVDMLEKVYLMIKDIARVKGLIFTFNGKQYDLPIMIARAEALNASVDTLLLDTLCSPSNWSHIDLYTSYRFMKKKYTNLSTQLFVRFGEKKVDINFDTCTDEKLSEYALQEMEITTKWVEQKMKNLNV